MSCLRAGCYWCHRLTCKLVRTQFIILKLEPFTTQKKKDRFRTLFFKHPTVITVLPSLSVFRLTEGQSLS